MLYGFLKTVFVRPYLLLICKGTIEGEENIPTSGGAILAINHSQAMDSVAVPGLVKRTMTFPAKAELFRATSFSGRMLGWLLRAIGIVPIERTGGEASNAGLQSVAKALRDGKLVGMYPEGTRSPDGRLYRGKTGVARLALLTDVPVIPVAVFNTKVVKRVLGIPVIRRPRVVVGQAIDFPEFGGEGAQTNPEVLRWVTDEVMHGIQQLGGFEYADVYAARVKNGDLKQIGSDEFVQARPGGGPVPPSA